MAEHASVKLLVLWEHELRAVAEAVCRLRKALDQDKPDPKTVWQAYVDLGQAAHVAMPSQEELASDASWLLCNHAALRFEPRVVEVAKRPMQNGGTE